MASGLQRVVDRVVRNGNCSGCGGCALVSSRIALDYDAAGFLTPSVSAAGGEGDDVAEAKRFREVCPGLSVTAPPATGRWHPIFGRYVAGYAGWAVDPDIRHAGSSAGVLTAINAWLVSTRNVHSVLVARQSSTHGTRSESGVARTLAEVRGATGSRYAPTATLGAAGRLSGRSAIVGRPCDVAAARTMVGAEIDGDPLMLAFLCAGTSSQLATRHAITNLGGEPETTIAVRYRGDGWPGDFVATDASGDEMRAPYATAWKDELGRYKPWRCKLCVDATGEHADIAVGDFWDADEQGYPLKTAADDARSVVIARTPRGDELLRTLRAAGLLELEPADLDEVARVQPHQVERRRSVAARQVARALVGRRGPRLRGFGHTRWLVRSPRHSIAQLVGTIRRSLRS